MIDNPGLFGPMCGLAGATITGLALIAREAIMRRRNNNKLPCEERKTEIEILKSRMEVHHEAEEQRRKKIDAIEVKVGETAEGIAWLRGREEQRDAQG